MDYSSWEAPDSPVLCVLITLKIESLQSPHAQLPVTTGFVNSKIYDYTAHWFL